MFGLAVLVVVTLSIVGRWLPSRRHVPQLESSPTVSAPSGVLEVNALRQQAPAIGTPLAVRGVVGAGNQAESVFALLDVAECTTCDPSACKQFFLPVRYRGPLPGSGSTVLVQGTVVQAGGGGLLIEADEVTPQ
jgi:hypothetical protein